MLHSDAAAPDAAPVKKVGAVEEKYPCYGIPIRVLLDLEAWVPHQDLLEMGKLVRMGGRDMAAAGKPSEKIIFCSHQWTSFEHPDPNGDQLRALQSVFRKLEAGELITRTNPILEGIYNFKRTDDPEYWKDVIDNGFIWHDFSCIPQPLSHKAKMEAAAAAAAAAATTADKPMGPGIQSMASMATMLNQRPSLSSSSPDIDADADADADVDADADADAKAGATAETNVPHHAGALAPRHAGMLNADHRKGNENDGEVIKRLTEQLTAAVDSIPAYVDRCMAMWVLVPPVEHHDVEGAVCSFQSWRTRGWCRMEFAAAMLATSELPVLIVDNENLPPMWVNPCDVPKLAAARGTFSYEDDRAKVVTVLHSMTRQKVQSLLDKGDLLFARLFQVLAVWFSGAVDRTGGLDLKLLGSDDNEDEDEEASRPAEDVAGSSSSSSSSPSVSVGAAAVERIKRRVGWRDDKTEAQFTKETGLNLLSFATAFDDLDAVKYLVEGPNADRSLMTEATKKVKIKDVKAFPHRKTPGFKMLINEPLFSPMGFAVAFGSTEVVDCLLNAGYPVSKGHATNEMVMWALMPGKIDNCTAVVAQRPGAVDFSDPGGPWGSILSMGTFLTETANQKDVYEWLARQGAVEKLKDKRSMLGVTALGYVGINLDATVETLTELVKLDPEFFKKDMHVPAKLPRTMGAMMSVWSALSGVSSSCAGMVKVFHFCGTGGTVLHDACWWGNLELIQALVVNLGVSPTTPCPDTLRGHIAAGLTPYEIVLLRWRGTAIQELAKALFEANGHGAAVEQASSSKQYAAAAAKLQRQCAATGKSKGKKLSKAADASSAAMKKKKKKKKKASAVVPVIHE